MEKLANFCFSMKTNTKVLARLKTGFFFKEVFERFANKTNSKLSPDRKLWLYSAHDTTIANILNSLGLFKVTFFSIYLYSPKTVRDFSKFNFLSACVCITLFQFQPLHIPQYGSCIFFELHKFNGTFHIEIYYKRYRGEDLEPLEPLSIPNCGKKCPLDRLYKIYRDILPTGDFDTECRLPEKTEYTNNVSVHGNSNKSMQ